MKNELQNRLLHFQEQPPAHVWPEIESALDQQMTPHATVLYNFQQAPPEDVWNKIEHSLQDDTATRKVVPLHSSRVHFMRYAAAAAILILLAGGITIMVTRNEKNSDLANQPAPTINNSFKAPDTNNSMPTTSPNTSIAPSKGAEDDVATTPIKKSAATSGRYLTVATDEGKKVRLSKKVAPVFDCADDVVSSRSIRCKESIESLQQKMSTSLLSPAGDFSGLVDMIKSLEENN